MPAPLEKQTEIPDQTDKKEQEFYKDFFLITSFASFQKALHIWISLQEIKENHRVSLCPFLLWAPQSSPIEKGGVGRICRVKGLIDHCSSTTKGNARSFVFSQSGRSLRAIISDPVRMWLLLDAACAHLLRSVLTPTTAVLEAQRWPARLCNQHSVAYLQWLPSRLNIYFCMFLLCII